MQWLISLIVAVLQVLLPWAVKQSRPTAGDADPDRETRDKLRDSVRKHWMIILLPLPLVLLLSSCAVRTVYVRDGTPVRLRETIEDAKVWVKNSDGEVVAGEMDLPEGWYALPMPEE